MSDKIIYLKKQYIGELDAYTIDDVIKASLKKEEHIILDLTTAERVQGAFYGNIIAIFKENYCPEEVFNQLKEKLTLKFKSPDSPAYESLQNGYGGLFTVKFSNRKTQLKSKTQIKKH